MFALESSSGHCVGEWLATDYIYDVVMRIRTAVATGKPFHLKRKNDQN